MIIQGDILLFFEQGVCCFQCFYVVFFLVVFFQVLVKFGVFFVYFDDGVFGLFFEIWFLVVDVIEMVGNFMGNFDMGYLIGIDWYFVSVVYKNIGVLKQWVVQEVVGGQVFFLQFFLLVFEGGYMFQLFEWCNY